MVDAAGSTSLISPGALARLHTGLGRVWLHVRVYIAEQMCACVYNIYIYIYTHTHA